MRPGGRPAPISNIVAEKVVRVTHPRDNEAMPTKKQLANLKRGGVRSDATTAARARAAKDAHREDEERIGELARADPQEALLELWEDLARGVKRLTRRWLNAGGDPSRELVNAWRECRMLTSEVAGLLRERGEGAAVERFFGQLDERVAAGFDRIGEPRPVVDSGGA